MSDSRVSRDITALAETLKPCPFCGKKPTYNFPYDLNIYGASITHTCTFIVILVNHEIAEEAVTAWNTRVENNGSS